MEGAQLGNIERDVGALEARMEAVEQEIHAMRSDVREIRDALVTARGGWRTLTLVIGLSASLGAAIAKLLPIAAAIRL
jgi:chromosome condensin MukBEF ATPase and DNA-binding subunit MukB